MQIAYKMQAFIYHRAFLRRMQKENMMESLLTQIKYEGWNNAIIQRCYDGDFCRIFKIDYCSPKIYEEISSLADSYIRQRGISNAQHKDR